MEAARGVSDPASRASGSVRARRAGSLTPPCQCPDCPDKRGPDRVQIRTRLRAQIQITIAPAVVLVIELSDVVL